MQAKVKTFYLRVSNLKYLKVSTSSPFRTLLRLAKTLNLELMRSSIHIGHFDQSGFAYAFEICKQWRLTDKTKLHKQVGRRGSGYQYW